MKRVVVTGMGMVTPLGCGVAINWQRLISNMSGISAISHFDVSDLPSQIAGIVPRGRGEGLFDPDEFVPQREQRRMDDFILYALAATTEAVEDSGWKPEREEDRARTGVIIGSGIGGLPGIAATAVMLERNGPRRVSPFFIPAALINLAAGHVSIKYGFTGPNHATVTACASGSHAIGDAARLIMFGDADVMIAGGTEAAVCRLGLAGFSAARALSTGFNDRPQEASRPWDRKRDGFVMSEGAAMLVLEDLEHARKRDARIYAEILGYGLSGDAHHITAPAENGHGAYRAMANALRNARIEPTEIDYINAHGTSTPLGDEIELSAVKLLFEKHAYELCISSTKSSVGHLLGAAGATEAIYTILSIRDGIVPPTLNLEDPAEGCDVDLVPCTARARTVLTALSNSFGFGGTNASLVFSAL